MAKNTTTITLEKDIQEKLHFFAYKRSKLINAILRMVFDGLTKEELFELSMEKDINTILDRLFNGKYAKPVEEEAKEQVKEEVKETPKPKKPKVNIDSFWE